MNTRESRRFRFCDSFLPLSIIFSLTFYFLVRPKTIVFGRTSVLRMMFFSEHEISEMRGPTGLKFCTMVITRPSFIMPVQNFGGAHRKKNFGDEKHAKFGPISDDFEVRRRISPKRMKIFKIG